MHGVVIVRLSSQLEGYKCIDSRDGSSSPLPPCRAWVMRCLQAYVFLWRSLMPKLPFLCAMEDQVQMLSMVVFLLVVVVFVVVVLWRI